MGKCHHSVAAVYTNAHVNHTPIDFLWPFQDVTQQCHTF